MKTILKRVFGYDDFKHGQEEIITALINKKHVFAILATGGGKSVCFQIPTIFHSGKAIIITPLVSLMEDQVRELKKKRIKAYYLSGNTTNDERRFIMEELNIGRFQFFYASPEMLSNPKILSVLTKWSYEYIFVDEVHTVIEWGTTFRDAFLTVPQILNRFGESFTLGLFTATSTNYLTDKLRLLFNDYDLVLFKHAMRRVNLAICIYKHNKKDRILKQILQSCHGKTIIYALTRKEVMRVYDLLCHYGNVTYYHGGLDITTRNHNYQQYANGSKNIMVATKAFGMGINISDIRNVIHVQFPESIEEYFQEIGRAGRDGQISKCYLIYSSKDLKIHRFFINESNNKRYTKSQIRKMIAYINTKECRMAYLSRHFSEDKIRCRICDNCRKSD